MHVELVSHAYLATGFRHAAAPQLLRQQLRPHTLGKRDLRATPPQSPNYHASRACTDEKGGTESLIFRFDDLPANVRMFWCHELTMASVAASRTVLFESIKSLAISATWLREILNRCGLRQTLKKRPECIYLYYRYAVGHLNLKSHYKHLSANVYTRRLTQLNGTVKSSVHESSISCSSAWLEACTFRATCWRFQR